MSWLFNSEIPELTPGQSILQTEGDHTFKITATDELGFHSGRRRYRVECLSCSVLVHEASTSASAQIDHHLRHVAEHCARGK